MRTRISSPLTKAFRNSYYVYLAILAMFLISDLSWTMFGFVLLGALATPFFHFSFFKDLKEVYETDEGLEIIEKKELIRIPFSDLTHVEKDGFSWYFPVTISTKSNGTFTVMPTDGMYLRTSKSMMRLIEITKSNQALQTTSASARRLS